MRRPWGFVAASQLCFPNDTKRQRSIMTLVLLMGKEGGKERASQQPHTSLGIAAILPVAAQMLSHFPVMSSSMNINLIATAIAKCLNFLS